MKIPELVNKAQNQAIHDALIEVLAESQTKNTAWEVRHIIKEKILCLANSARTVKN